MQHQVVQFNVAKLRAPMDDPLIAEFAEALEPINALAEVAPGFVWRLQTEDGNATSIKLYDDGLVLWWLPAGTIPDPNEGVRRLEQLREHGPTPIAFTLRRSFPPSE